MQQEQDPVDKFISNKPFKPNIDDFVKQKSNTISENRDKVKKQKQEEEPIIQSQYFVGPVYHANSDEEGQDEDTDSDQAQEEPFKQMVLNSGAVVRKQSTHSDTSSHSSSSSVYVDPAALARDPALKELLQNQQDNETQQQQPHHSSNYNLPITHELIFRGHSRAITSISIDPAGSRICTGSFDYFTRLWDFQGMDKNFHSFRVVEPIEGHPIYQTSWSKDGRNILVVAGDPQACILDREGKRVLDTHKGDMYIRDILKTVGHTASINAGMFHPDHSEIFLTCSNDGTMRMWDMNQKLYGIAQQLSHKSVLKCLDDKGHKMTVRNLTVRSGYGFALASCENNTIQGFAIRGQCSTLNPRPQIMIRDAHKSHVSTMRVLKDGHSMISLSTDNTMKLWDLRNTKHYVLLENISINASPATRFDLNQDESLLVTARHRFTESSKLESDTELTFYNTSDLTVHSSTPMFDTAVTDVLWHPVLNQIFVGGTDGHVRALFNPSLSQKGTLLSVAKTPKFFHPEQMDLQRHILNPNELPVFKEGQFKNNKLKIVEHIKTDKEKVRKPEPPQNGPGKGGKISGASTVTQFIMRSINEAPEKEDVREQLTKLDKITRDKPQYVMQAYQTTQPITIYDTTTPEVEENALLSAIKVICPHCGMKICACKRKVV